MLIGLAVPATVCGPELVRALANVVFQALIHLKRLIWRMMTLLHLLARIIHGGVDFLEVSGD